MDPNFSAWAKIWLRLY